MNKTKIEMKAGNIPTSKIDVGLWNVRTLDRDKGLEDLKESIQEYGLLQPVVVFEEKGRYNLIIGQRRLRAIKELRKERKKGKQGELFEEISAVVLSAPPDELTAKLLSLNENIHRVELNRADIVDVISYLYEKYDKSAKRVAKVLGKSVGFVYDHLRIKDAPDEIRQMLSRQEITKQDVKRVMEVAADDKTKMIELAKEMKDLTGPEKQRLVETGRLRPEAKTKDLVEQIKKPVFEEKIIVSLPPQLTSALSKAAKDIGLSREEIARKALEDWLNNKGYYRE
jgi:ParB family chromosome partitioning protein